ncbi:hypothetical protein [uncultured Algibacter sp.]|uniref:hypothetical protein n=1 Tax=uncultured Algibacter sp. TaxID=298659 RepID=UPI0026063429|nr:hypothetical protein [uncultured Algibacter sp.]
MNIKLFLILLMVIQFSGLSQNIEITKGEITKDRQFLIDKNEMTACDNKGNFVALRPHRINGSLRNYFIEFFNDLNFIERQEIETKNLTEILDFFIKDNKIHVLIRETTSKEISVRFDLFDLFEKQKSSKILITANKETDKVLYKALKSENTLSLDYNSNYLLSFQVLNKESIYSYLKLFDSNFNLIKSEKITPNHNSKIKNISHLNTKLHGKNIYLLYNIQDEEAGNYYKLINISNEKTRELIIPIEQEFYQLINSKIEYNNYTICGLYSKKKKGGFQGLAHYNINLTKFEISSSKLSQFKSEEAKKYFIGLFKANRSLDIKDIFIDTNNNTFIVGQFYTLRKQYAPVGIPLATFTIGSMAAFITYNPISTTYKVYDDILIAKIDASGNLIWDKVLGLKQTEKIQSKFNQKDSSYFAYLKNDQLNILLNGYINPSKEKLVIQQDKRNSKTNLYNLVISEKGNISSEIFIKNSDSEILFIAEKSIETNHNKIFNLGQGNMRKQLIKIEL